ncbi:hypothetical protein LWE61_13550 [Sphingobium sufflavum]|nr:hypothetical protein [Sphingobium sufflavum]
MDGATDRLRVFGRVAAAHIFGLSVTGSYGTIGTTAGFNVITGSFLGIFLGGLLSVPWIIALSILIWFRASWIERHPLIFSIIGPPLIIASYALLGGAFLDAITLATISASIFYLSIFVFQRCLLPRLLNVRY